MILKKLSASALKSSETCMARFKAERDAGYGARIERDFNKLGSACHQALEYYVQTAIMDQGEQPDFSILKLFYMQAFKNWFGKLDTSHPSYQDGLDLLEKWYNRTDFGSFEIISLESKETFDLPTPAGQIPFTYIMDRLDKTGENTYRVVDYKTSRTYMSPDNLFGDIQSRIYALAVQIKYPDAEEIEVMFDMLRFQPVSVFYRKHHNIETWKMLKEAATSIVEADEDSPSETLNDTCIFCIRKTSCSAISKNASVGGVHNLPTMDAIVERRAQLAAQEKAAKSAREELDALILTHMKENEIFDIDTEFVTASAKVSMRRSVDADRVAEIIGEEAANKYLTRNLTMRALDEMLASGNLPVHIIQKVESCIEQIPSEPRIETKFKTRFS